MPSAFEFLLHEFNKVNTYNKNFKGYRLLASDGSDLKIATNPDDLESYFQNRPGEKGFNLLHINIRLPNQDKAIFVGDRGYECYNVFAHIENIGQHYVVRIKDVDRGGILSGFSTPTDGEFDVCTKGILTQRRTNEIKNNPHIYKVIRPNAKFDFLDDKNPFYSFSFRFARLQLDDGSYETLVTNLPACEFSVDDLKIIYKLRWGIETSFRKLKHTIGLANFHAKKRELIIQEVFARVIMYNFAEMVTSRVIISQSDKKHVYQANFTVAVLVCRQFLQNRHNVDARDVCALIRKNILPIRPGRSYTRKTRAKPTVSFNYRVA